MEGWEELGGPMIDVATDLKGVAMSAGSAYKAPCMTTRTISLLPPMESAPRPITSNARRHTTPIV